MYQPQYVQGAVKVKVIRCFGVTGWNQQYIMALRTKPLSSKYFSELIKRLALYGHKTYHVSCDIFCNMKYISIKADLYI